MNTLASVLVAATLLAVLTLLAGWAIQTLTATAARVRAILNGELRGAAGWSPREGDRVWLRGSGAPHQVTFVHDAGSRVLCMNVDHPSSRADVPAAWVRPIWDA